MNDFFVGRTNSGEDSAEFGAGGFGLASDKIIRTEANTPFHWHGLIVVKIEPLGIDEGWLVIALQDIGRGVESFNRFVDRGSPVGVRQVAAQINSAGSPGVSGKAGDFQDELALFVGQQL